MDIDDQIQAFFTDANLYWATLDDNSTGDEGSHYTSFDQANKIAAPPLREGVFSEDVPSMVRRLENLTILDPACGVGSLLVVSAYYLASKLAHLKETHVSDEIQRVLSTNVYGVDVNSETVHEARRLFEKHFGACPDLRVGNALKSMSEAQTKQDLRDMGVKNHVLEWFEAQPSIEKVDFSDPDVRDFTLLAKHGSEVFDFEALVNKDHGHWQEIKELANKHKLFHWELEYPEIFEEKGGFDVLVANPPFLGSQNQGELDDVFRSIIGTGLDLSIHFFLQYNDLVADQDGYVSSLASNSICQGKNRKRGLKPFFKDFNCYRAVRTMEWEGAANVQVSLVHCARHWDRKRYLDLGSGKFQEVEHISTHLDEYPDFAPDTLLCTGPSGNQGFILRGKFHIHRRPGDSLTDAIEQVPKAERDALTAYLTTHAVQQNPTPTPADVVIDFYDLLAEKGLDDAPAADQLEWLEDEYGELLDQLREPSPHAPEDQPVAESRQELGDTTTYRKFKEKWWLYGPPNVGLRKAWASVDEMAAFPRVTKVWSPLYLPKKLEVENIGEKLRICPIDKLFLAPQFSGEHMAVTCSFLFEVLVRRQCSTRETTLRFTPTEVFPYFPWPWKPEIDGHQLTVGEPSPQTRQRLETAGEHLLELRTDLLENPSDHGLSRDLVGGPTDLYNLYDSPECTINSIEDLREAHKDLLKMVLTAYGWDDMCPVNWVFDKPWVDQTIRFVPDFETRKEILVQLEQLNHQRYEEELGMLKKPVR